MNAWLPEGMAASVYWPDTESMPNVLNEEFNHGTSSAIGDRPRWLKEHPRCTGTHGVHSNAYSWK